MLLLAFCFLVSMSIHCIPNLESVSNPPFVAYGIIYIKGKFMLQNKCSCCRLCIHRHTHTHKHMNYSGRIHAIVKFKNKLSKSSTELKAAIFKHACPEYKLGNYFPTSKTWKLCSCPEWTYRRSQFCQLLQQFFVA